MFTNFFEDTRGNVIMIFGLCLIPMFALAGFAVDYQQTIKRKTKVQLLLDSSVLAGARVKQTDASDAVVKQAVKDFLSAQIDGLGGMTCDAANVIVHEDSEEIDADITCRQNTYIMKVIGQNQIEFKVSSGSDYGIDKIDVAFMFDISGSMNSDSRLTNLKSAAQDAVDTLLPEGASQELIDNTRLAMVSYNAMVNAGEHFEDVAGVPATRTYTHEIVPEYTEDDLTEGDIFDAFQIGLYDTDTDDMISEIGQDAVIEVQDWMDDDLTIGITLDSSHDLYGQVDSIRMNLSGAETQRPD